MSPTYCVRDKFPRQLLNILQIDVLFSKTPVGKICMFANDSDIPLELNKFNCFVCRASITGECENPDTCDIDCRLCELKRIDKIIHCVRYGNGVFLDLKNHETYGVIYDGTMHLSLRRQRDLLKFSREKTMVIKMDGYKLSFFLSYMKASAKYTEVVTNYLSERFSATSTFVTKVELITVLSNRLQISLQEPKAHVLDLAWARRACRIVHEVTKSHMAMTWLSTLGGAFSALGDEQLHCAELAGRVSIEQLRLAQQTGNKLVVAQCKLYLSLSLMQRGHLGRARRTVFEQFMNQKNSRRPDIKTMNMCRGIWAKLKFLYAKRAARNQEAFVKHSPRGLHKPAARRVEPC